MANEFNIRELYEQSFSKEPPADFGLPVAAGRNEYSSHGQPYYTLDEWGREHYMPVHINGKLISFATIAIHLRKTFKSEPMPERKGSVHELISIDDCVFNVKGILVSNDNEFPEKEYNKMVDLFYVNASLRLDCVKTAPILKGDDKVIIRDIPLPPTPGVQNAQAFEINLMSDSIFTLNLD